MAEVYPIYRKNNFEAWLSGDVKVLPALEDGSGRLRLSDTVDDLIFFVPGNPGVFSAYLPWLDGLMDKIQSHHCSKCVIVFSSHLGHMRSIVSGKSFTCAENAEHQMERILDVCTVLKKNQPHLPRLLFVGHSAGAHFLQRALIGVVKHLKLMFGEQRYECEIHPNIQLLFMCGTLCKFGPTGTLKAEIAASDFGRRLICYLVKSKLADKIIKNSIHMQQMSDEFTESFISHMSSLTKDELINLPSPESIHQELDRINCNVFFAFASRDPYVPQSIQRKILDSQPEEHVYISNVMPHGFPVHPPSFQESISIVYSVFKNRKFIGRTKQINKNMLKFRGLSSFVFLFWNVFACTLLFVSQITRRF